MLTCGSVSGQMGESNIPLITVLLNLFHKVLWLRIISYIPQYWGIIWHDNIRNFLVIQGGICQWLEIDEKMQTIFKGQSNFTFHRGTATRLCSTLHIPLSIEIGLEYFRCSALTICMGLSSWHGIFKPGFVRNSVLVKVNFYIFWNFPLNWQMFIKLRFFPIAIPFIKLEFLTLL